MSSVDNRPRSHLIETYKALSSCPDMKRVKKGEITFPSMPDVDSNKYLIAKGKTSMIGTTKLGSCFAVCARGITKENEPVIGLCHKTNCYYFEYIQDVLFKGMVEEGCDARNISTYVIGGCRIKKDPSSHVNASGSTSKEEKHILRVSKERNVTGVNFALVKTEVPAVEIEETLEGLVFRVAEDTTYGSVVLTPENLFFGNTGNLFSANEDHEDAGIDLPDDIDLSFYDHVHTALSACKDITFIESTDNPVKAPDIDSDKFMVMVGENALLGTSKLSPAFAICARGVTKNNMPVIGLCRSSGIVGFEDAHDTLVEEMVAKGCVQTSIATYVIGGDTENTKEDETSVIRSWKERNIQGVDFDFDQETDSPSVLLSPTYLHYSLNNLFVPADRKSYKSFNL